jgi:glycosyltransferase involved in cell wall biosynthesis
MPNRILFVDQYGYMGGAQRVLLDLIHGLRANDCQVVVALNGQGEFRDELIGQGVRVEWLPLGPYRSGRKSAADFLRFTFHTLYSARLLSNYVKRHSSTLIYANGPRAFIACALAGRKTHRQVIWHLHNVFQSGLELRLIGRFGQMADHIVACCNAAVDPLIRHNPSLKSKTHVIYNGIPSWLAPPSFPGEKVIKEKSSPPHGLVFGILGRITPAKGQKIFLDAASLILREFPDTRFLIVGSPAPGDPIDQAYWQNLLQQARDPKLVKCVRFETHQKNVSGVYALLDVVVVASTMVEGCSMTILEAMASNLPVIAPASGGPLEMLRHEETGILVKCMDHEKLAAAMKKLICNPTRRSAIALAAQEEAHQRFSQKLFLEEMMKLLQICHRSEERRVGKEC